jgi:hypothetical protein
LSGIPIDHLIITQAQSAWLRKPVHSIQWVYGFVVRETPDVQEENAPYNRPGKFSYARRLRHVSFLNIILLQALSNLPLPGDAREYIYASTLFISLLLFPLAPGRAGRAQ